MSLAWFFYACIGGWCAWSHPYATEADCHREEQRIVRETGARLNPHILYDGDRVSSCKRRVQ